MSAAAPSRAERGGARWGSLRTRLLAGGFLIIFCAWSVDTLTNERGPKKAAAATGAPAAGAFVIADPPDRAALDRFLSDLEQERAPLVIDAPRDPFAMPADWATVAQSVQRRPADSQPVETVVSAEPAPSAEPREKPFSEAHQLQGVILGARPLALIDGKGYRIGDRVDGYRIVALSRDAVELTGRSGRVVLRVAGPELKSVRSLP